MSCGSPMPRGEQIAKPAERTTRLAGFDAMNLGCAVTDILDRLTASLADRYSVQRELGRGGMAIVYLAVDRKHERPVALKVLRPDLAAALGADRFLREIRIAARLQHPNLLPLYDSGEADGLLYYVMPYIEGESLRARLARSQHLPLEQA